MRTIFEFSTRMIRNKKPKIAKSCFSSRFFNKHLEINPKVSYKLSDLLIKGIAPSEICKFNSPYKIYIEINNEELAMYMDLNPKECLNPSKKSFLLERTIVIDDDMDEKLLEIKENVLLLKNKLKASKDIITKEIALFSDISSIFFSREKFLLERHSEYEYISPFVPFEDIKWYVDKNKSLSNIYSLLKNKLEPIMMQRKKEAMEIETILQQYKQIIGI